MKYAYLYRKYQILLEEAHPDKRNPWPRHYQFILDCLQQTNLEGSLRAFLRYSPSILRYYDQSILQSPGWMRTSQRQARKYYRRVVWLYTQVYQEVLSKKEREHS